MIQPQQGEFHVGSESDIVLARKIVRDLTAEAGFGLTDVTRIVTAASELTRNIHLYAGSGLMRWQSLTSGSRVGLELIFEDQGPGIPDIEKAMESGYSTSKGLGLGLPGSKRLMDEMTIKSKTGHGTVISIRKWLNK